MALDDVTPRMAKASLNSVDTDFLTAIGAAIARAIALVGWSRKEAAAKVGVDEAQLSRWIAGDSRNRPQFDRLFAVPELRQPLVIGLSALADGAEVVTEIRFRRRA